MVPTHHDLCGLFTLTRPMLIHLFFVVPGDTSFELFLNPPTEDLLKVKLLITEATYVDNNVDKSGKPSTEKARERGHCHLQEFVQHEHLFENVENILFIHFSDKYSSGYVQRMVQDNVPDSLRSKMHLGVQLKERYSNN